MCTINRCASASFFVFFGGGGGFLGCQDSPFWWTPRIQKKRQTSNLYMEINACRFFTLQGKKKKGKTGKIVKKKKTVRENTGNLDILPKHREFGLLKL